MYKMFEGGEPDLEEELLLEDIEVINENQDMSDSPHMLLTTKEDTNIQLIKQAKDLEMTVKKTQEVTNSLYLRFASAQSRETRLAQVEADTAVLSNILTQDRPSFVSEFTGASLRKMIDKIDLSNSETIINIFDTFVKNPAIRDPQHLALFRNYLVKIRDSQKNHLFLEATNSATQIAESTAFISRVVGPEFLAYHADEEASMKSHLITKGVLTTDGIDFICGNPACKKHNHYTGKPLAIYPSENVVIRNTPIKCPYCGHYSILPEKPSEKLLKDVVKSGELNSLAKVVDPLMDYAKVYYPPVEKILEAFSGILEDSEDALEVALDLDDENDTFYQDDSEMWNSMVSYWSSLHKSLLDKDLMNKNNEKDIIGTHQLAKIIASQTQEYDVLKENAIASLITLLDQHCRQYLSTSYRNGLELYLSYLPEYDKFKSKLKSMFPTKESLANVANEIEEFDKHRDLFVEDLNKCSALLANTPISSLSLTQSMISSYMTYKPLRDVILHISDLMIITSQGESFIEYYKPRVYDADGKPKLDVGYNKCKKDLQKLISDISFSKALTKFVLHFQIKLGYAQKGAITLSKFSPVSLNNFILHTIHSYSLLEELTNLSTTALRDFYDACILMSNIRSKSSARLMSLIDALRSQPRYSAIAEVLQNFPSVTCSKFEYYFPELTEATEEEQEELLSIYESKRAIPETLEGDTIAEKIQYYRSLNSVSFPRVDKRESSFKAMYYIHLLGMSSLDYKLMFNNWATFYLGKDLLISLTQTPLEKLYKLLYVYAQVDDFNLPDASYNLSDLAELLIYSDDNLEAQVNDVTSPAYTNLKRFTELYDLIIRDLQNLDFPMKVVDSVAKKLGYDAT